MTWAVDPEIAALFRGDADPVARILSLDTALRVRAGWESSSDILLSGSVTATRTAQIRRTGDVALASEDGGIIPDAAGDCFAAGELIRVERGIRVAGVPFYVPLATLVITEFHATLDGKLTLRGQDRLCRLQQPLGDALTLPVGMRGEDALRALWEPVLGDSSAWRLDAGGHALSAIRVYPEENDRLGAGIMLASDLGCEAFAGRDGIPVLRPAPDPVLAPVSRAYGTGSDSLILTLDRGGSTWPFNRVVVISEGPEQPTVRGVAEIT